jgi:D-threo-aldose 1-dehydrogenase
VSTSGATSRHAEVVPLGETGVQVTRLGLGTAPLGGMYTAVDEADAVDLVMAAIEAGIGYVDTAPYYGHGVAERRLGRGLAAAGMPRVTLSTKVGRVLVRGKPLAPSLFADAAPEQPVFDFSGEGVRVSLESSLERLGVDRVDLVLIHDPDDYQREALTEAYPALEKLRSQGVVRAIGVGMNQTRIPTRFVRETDIDVVLVAGRFTLLDQQAQDDLFLAALDRGVSILAAGVFNSGVLADPRPGGMYDYQAAPPELISRAVAIRATLEEVGVPLTAAALQFPLRHPAVRAVVIGARDRAELVGNIDDFNREVPDDCWKVLEERGLVSPMPS